MDKIVLSGIEFYAFGGTTQAEKQLGHRYRVNVELGLDLSLAARTDSLADSVDYGAVAKLVIETARERSRNLLEAMAGRIANRILESFAIEQVTVEVQKLNPPVDAVIGYSAVQITRMRDREAPL